ncbi:MAG TPA: hypothetical protein VIV09_18105 [Pseudolabrys sp.]
MQGEHHRHLAEMLVASISKVMPEVPVFHLTDGHCPTVPGTEVLRIHGAMPMGVRRVSHYIRPGEWCFVDTDVLFKKDVRPVFDKPFDVALCSRKGTYMEGTEYAKEMPHNFGVVFSRQPEFWREVLMQLKKLPPELQEWEGEQALTGIFAKHPKYKVEILSSAYNFTPKARDEDVSHASILHLKGHRKAWMSSLA